VEVVRATVQAGKNKMPVLAATGINYPLSLEMARAAEKTGADGLLVFPPYYPNADIEGLFQYYKSVAEATSLGIIIYSRDWANFSPADVERLAAIPNLIAWKDGQADIRRYQMIMNRLGDRLLWIGGAGDDVVPGYYSLGIRAYTSSIANVAPRLSLKLHELASRQDVEELPGLMSRFVTPLYALRARRKGYEVSAMKVMMDRVEGLTGGPVRPPLVEVADSERRELEAMVEDWKAWL
jgi:5-dehydro-4-deoxyglucarate dehydratase